MSNQPTVLSDDELEQKILNIIEHNTLEEHTAVELIMNIINAQKIAHADMVIGEDNTEISVPVRSWQAKGVQMVMHVQNELRNVQRERNVL